MKLTVVGVAIIILLSAFAYIKASSSNQPVASQQASGVLKKNVMACAPLSDDAYSPDSSGSDFPLLDGWSFHLPVSTTSDSAQLYFDQGLVLYYSFHNEEAKASFRKARRFDTSCAMLFWGEAMCHNEYVHNQSLNQPAIADSLVKIAARYMNKASAFEQAIIRADAILLNRDASETDSIRLNKYEAAMENLYKRFPGNADAAGAFISAVMWNGRHAHEAVKQLYISMLQKFPGHPYLNHLFIHFIESTEPQLAMPSAASLLQKTPGISHMVHMASHVYVNTGRYSEGVEVNEKARALYNHYIQVYPSLNAGTGIYAYAAHPISMELSNAVNMPYYDTAVTVAGAETGLQNSINETRLKRGLKKLNPKGTGAQTGASYLDWVQVRYGKWNAILEESLVPDSIKLRRYIQQFAKGMALARTGRYAEAGNHLGILKLLIQDSLFDAYQASNKFSASLQIAIPLLQAVMEEEQAHYTAAESAYKEAIVFEDALKYDDPNPWYIEVRPFLGNCLLKDGNHARAEAVFKEDLNIRPDNYWGLRGLMLALQKQHKTAAANATRDKIKVLYPGLYTEPLGAVY